MGEIKFVLMSFIFSVLLLLGLQIKVGDSTIEAKATRWAYQSNIPNHLTKVAAGGALMIRDLITKTKQISNENFGRTEDQKNEVKSRLPSFERSEAYLKSRSSSEDR